jgi:16S rRNA (cytidine1402-2'-O)-methyltransferase
MLFYESPHRVIKTLTHLQEAFGNRRVVLARELTKRYEEFVRGTIEECSAWLAEHPPLGEYVIVVEGESKEEADLAGSAWWREISIEEHVAHYETSGSARKDAMKKLRSGTVKRDIYNALLRKTESTVHWSVWRGRT